MTTKQPAHVTSRTVFDREFEREVLLSERLRAAIIGGFGAGLLALITLGMLIPPILASIQTVFRGQLVWYAPYVLVGPLVVYEGVMWRLATRALNEGRTLSRVTRILNAFVEISVPTLIILFAGQIFGLIIAINTPPLLIYFLFIAIAALRLDFRLCVFTGAVAAVEYLIVSFIAIGQVAPDSGIDPLLTAPLAHIGRAGVMLLAGLATGMVTGQIRRRIAAALQEVEERNRIIGLFGQHVSPAVVERLLAQDVQLASETRDVTVMFLDIRGFTQFAEKKQPQEVVEYLNALFSFMVDSVNRHHGIINKFLGDGFMAVFGAPLSSGEDTRNAVACARELIQRVEEEVRLGHIPATRIGIGLDAGHAVTGNIGAPERQEYTIIGDVVNLASRIEGLNKQYESQLLISESVWGRIQREQAGGTSLGPVQIRGHEVPVGVYKLA